jgi:hypothetical protein
MDGNVAGGGVLVVGWLGLNWWDIALNVAVLAVVPGFFAAYGATSLLNPSWIKTDAGG